mgnify:FL=1
MSCVSIIIPVYNAEQYLEKCIKSCCHQSFRNIEIIVIDNNSTDNSILIIQEIMKYDERIKLYIQEKRGVSHARNLGILKSSGEYITFIDSDDWIDSTYIENLVSEMDKDNYDIVISGMVKVNQNGTKIIEKNIIEDIYIESQHMCSMLFNKDSFIYKGPCCKMYLSRIIKDNSIFFAEDLSFGEDTIFVLDYLSYSKNIKQISYCGYNYRQLMNETKKKRYGADNVEMQWNIGKRIYNKRSVFLSKKDVQNIYYYKVGILLLDFIRLFMNICVYNQCKRNDILLKLKEINDSEIKYLKRLKNGDITNKLDKILRWLLIYKAYNFIYLLFLLKTVIYNKILLTKFRE